MNNENDSVSGRVRFDLQEMLTELESEEGKTEIVEKMSQSDIAELIKSKRKPRGHE